MAVRTWLAVILCCLVWFVYMRWFAPPPPPVGAKSAAVASAPKTPSLEQGSGIPVSAGTSSPFSVRPAFEQSAVLTSAQREIVFSSAGGKISAVRLKEFRQTLKKDSLEIESISPGQMPLALSTLFSESVLSELGYGEYRQESASPNVRFKKTVAGVTVDKVFEKGNDDFLIQEKITISFPKGSRRDWGYLLLPIGGYQLVNDAENPLQAWEAVAYQSDSVTRKALTDIKSGSEVLQGNTQWVAFGNRYFTTALINQSAINPDVVFESGGDFTGVYLRYPLALKTDQDQLTFDVRIFSGPKEYSELAKVAGMRSLIDYGMFSVLAFPLLELLRFFYRFLHNYGLAIILLTLLVRAIFYPLSLKSYRSMKAMQKLQPQIQALKEKYKDDTARFGQEQMALFRAHKVNPAGGCLPILVQLPVFIALYAVLQSSIELFHAPFYGWIQDLSSKDPYYVFPVLMGISMFVQQKMTPAVGMDPMQQKILLLMPVIFTFIMLNLPSGLTIYIFVSTVLGILQQVLINREIEKSDGKLVPATSPTQGK